MSPCAITTCPASNSKRCMYETISLSLSRGTERKRKLDATADSTSSYTYASLAVLMLFRLQWRKAKREQRRQGLRWLRQRQRQQAKAAGERRGCGRVVPGEPGFRAASESRCATLPSGCLNDSVLYCPASRAAAPAARAAPAWATVAVPSFLLAFAAACAFLREAASSARGLMNGACAAHVAQTWGGGREARASHTVTPPMRCDVRDAEGPPQSGERVCGEAGPPASGRSRGCRT